MIGKSGIMDIDWPKVRDCEAHFLHRSTPMGVQPFMAVGNRRNSYDTRHRMKDQYGLDVGAADFTDVFGAVVAGIFAIWGGYPPPVATTIHRRSTWKDGIVGFHPRGTLRHDRNMIVHPDDEDFWPIVLLTCDVHGSQIPLEYHFRGWITAGEGKRREWWFEQTREPFYRVPQRALRPMYTLPLIAPRA